MNLTPEQLKVIREATIDEDAFHRVITLFKDDVQASSTDDIPSDHLLFNLDPSQIKLIETVISAIPAVIFVKDLNSRFVIANQACLELNGLSTLDEIIGKTDFDIMPAENAQVHFDMEQTLFRTGQPLIDKEVNYIDTDQSEKWRRTSKSPIYDQDHKVVGLIGIIRDITSEKLAEKSLENERNVLQTLIDHVQAKIYIKDRESRFIVANAETLRTQYVSSAELLGSTDADYMPAERAQQMFEEEQTIMETGQAIINQELFTPYEVTKDDDRWFLVTKVPTYDENGVVTGLVGVNRDITTVKLAEQKAIELKLEQERSRILADFITNSSHEFRTPISIINTSAYLLRKISNPDKQQLYIERITEQTTHLMNLLESLLLMSRLDRLTQIETEVFNLNSFLKNMTDQFQSKLSDKNQTLNLVMDTPEVNVNGDQRMLATAVSAILDNALRYTPDQGEITISGSLQDDEIIINIKDTGSGIGPEDKNRIFERFYREDKAHSTSGFGLGLPSALRIIMLHDGRIEIESEVNIGSQFKIVLPQHP
jgi:PAS domain S-box-containing protein